MSDSDALATIESGGRGCFDGRTNGILQVMDCIQPHNRNAFERLLKKIQRRNEGVRYSSSDWVEIHAQMDRAYPRWFCELLETYPLAGVVFYIPWKEPTPAGATCEILVPDSLKHLSKEDYFFVDNFFPEWLQIGEAFHFGGPGRWLIPCDQSQEPIVHAFSDADDRFISTGKRLDDFLLAASLTSPIRPDSAGVTAMKKRLEGIIVPIVRFEQATLPEIVEILRRLSKEHDPVGLGIEIEITEKALKVPQYHRLTASPRNQDLHGIIQFCAGMMNLKSCVTETGVRIQAIGEDWVQSKEGMGQD